jgi:hypothetical protein
MSNKMKQKNFFPTQSLKYNGKLEFQVTFLCEAEAGETITFDLSTPACLIGLKTPEGMIELPPYVKGVVITT